MIAARSYYPGLLPSISFIISYFALQGVCTGLIIAATQGDLATPAPMSIIAGLAASAIAQLMLMWLYLRKQGRMAILGLNSFGKVPLRQATALAVVVIMAAMAFNYIYATYIIPGVGMQEEMAKILAALHVDAPAVARNLGAGGGRQLAERIMLALGAKAGRQVAHEVLRAHAAAPDFVAALRGDARVAAAVTPAELDALLDPTTYIGSAPAAVDRIVAAYGVAKA
jgi:hypothetical protein